MSRFLPIVCVAYLLAFVALMAWIIDHTPPPLPEPQAIQEPAAPILYPVTVTAYTRKSGPITASGHRVRKGIIAVSRDLERELGLKFRDKLRLHGCDIDEPLDFLDRMHHKWTDRVDVFFDCPRQAKRFGIQTAMLEVK
jgi:3D (Asp-Asp-Asp) domain-containing protein